MLVDFTNMDEEKCYRDEWKFIWIIIIGVALVTTFLQCNRSSDVYDDQKAGYTVR